MSTTPQTLESLWPAQQAWTLEPDGSRTLRVSPHSLDVLACPMKYRNYKLLGRQGTSPRIAAVAGAAFHAGKAAWSEGKSVAEQDVAIAATFAAEGLPNGLTNGDGLPDYRTPLYVQDALAQYRAEHAAPRWKTLRVEDAFEVELLRLREYERDRHCWLGPEMTTLSSEPWRVMMVVRIDEALLSDEGRLYLLDTKTSSDDRKTAILGYQNSRQFLLYAMAYYLRYGEKPLGLLPDRVIMRKPIVRRSEKSKPTWEFPIDSVVDYSYWSRVEEAWATAQGRARWIIENLDKPDAWVMEQTHCVREWGACEFLPACCLPPEQRALKLASDAYQEARKR